MAFEPRFVSKDMIMASERLGDAKAQGLPWALSYPEYDDLPPEIKYWCCMTESMVYPAVFRTLGLVPALHSFYRTPELGRYVGSKSQSSPHPLGKGLDMMLHFRLLEIVKGVPRIVEEYHCGSIIHQTLYHTACSSRCGTRSDV